MGSPALPAAMAQMLMQKLAGGGAPPQGMGAPPQGPQPSPAGQQIASQLSELQGADPQSTLKILMQIKSQLVAIYPRTAFTMPGVANNVAATMKSLDRAIEDAKKGAAVEQTVSPIANNAGQPQQGPEQPSNGLPGLQQFAMGAQ